ncbi:WAP four-disulfide core domain protein 18-like [Arvicola amphibius]|uniref:WAP four-disulfide core domain protein 18-like n=1 Tax=Arvicola amphibius TaxID=1047088 RepID=UPI0018E35DAD|nr:WAP four-disulfide core domain protein 18-like [Arvicola amphibius]
MKTSTVLVLLALMACTLSSTTGLEKPGACPTLPPNSAGICIEKCSGDDSCPDKLKCCSNGCGHVCKSPAS